MLITRSVWADCGTTAGGGINYVFGALPFVFPSLELAFFFLTFGFVFHLLCGSPLESQCFGVFYVEFGGMARKYRS